MRSVRVAHFASGPGTYAGKLSNGTIKAVQNIPISSRISLVCAVLISAIGCGQFFPGGNTITSLQVAPTSATVQPGTTQQYTATATYGNNTTADVTSQVTWSTNPTSIATINSTGLLTGVALGTANIRATSSNGIIGTTGVTVATKQVTSVAIQPLTQTLSLSLGPTTVQYTATATYGDGSTANITAIATWTSTPSSVTTISSTGLATAVAVGTATIAATSGGVTSNGATVSVTP